VTEANGSKAAVRRYFDEDVPGYLAAYADVDSGARGEIFRERRRIVLDLVPAPAGRVLDIGSGPGVFTAALLERGARCWVADLSLPMVRAGRAAVGAMAEGGRLHHHVADVERLPFLDGAFDTVLCVGVLQYLEAPHAALRELARVCRVRGRVIVTFPNRQSPLNRLHRAVVILARAARTGLADIGIAGAPPEHRLTFRDDIPNLALGLADVARIAERSRLRTDAIRYHSLHFPVAIPGFGPVLRGWDRTANGPLRRVLPSRWAREVVARFERSG
jgi:SAM-dependent methyltransferase